jgi:hypothetical protein
MRIGTGRLILAAIVGCLTVAVLTLWQPNLRVGSTADLFCDLMLLPGKLFATLFPDRGTASQKFLWRSRVANAFLYAVVTFFLVKWLHPHTAGS